MAIMNIKYSCTYILLFGSYRDLVLFYNFFRRVKYIFGTNILLNSSLRNSVLVCHCELALQTPEGQIWYLIHTKCCVLKMCWMLSIGLHTALTAGDFRREVESQIELKITKYFVYPVLWISLLSC